MEDFVRQLKERVILSEIIGRDVTLTQKGTNIMGLCPFHDEKTASFKVTNDKGFYHCFGCGENGDAITYLQKTRQLEFMEAITELANGVGMTVPSRSKSTKKRNSPIYGVMEKAASVYHECLTTLPEGEEGRRYLEKRGIPKEIVEKYKIGMAPDPQKYGWQYLLNKLTPAEKKAAKNAGLFAEKKSHQYDRFRNRIMMPVFNSTGQIVAFTGRTLDDDQAQYINSPETEIFKKSHILLGLFQNKSAIRLNKQALLVEGAFDFLSLVKHGVDTATASMGTALTIDQLTILTSMGTDLDIYLLFDGDIAGLRAMYRAAPMFLKLNIRCHVGKLPEKHDPDTYITKYGREKFDELVYSGAPLIEFLAEELLKINKGAIGKKFVDEMHKLLKNCPTKLLKQRLLQGVAVRLNVDIGLLLQDASLEVGEMHLEPEPPKALQTQFSRRIIAFLLHNPDKYDWLSKCSFQKFCSDSFSRCVCQVFEDNSTENSDIIEMFRGTKWVNEIDRILNPSSIESRILALSNPHSEMEAFSRWVQQQAANTEMAQYKSSIITPLLQGDLPPKDVL